MSPLQLSDQQKNAFSKFRELASDFILPHHQDYYLLKWLKERNFDPKRGADMFRESMKWRLKHGIDDIIETWNPPKFYEIFSVRGMVGFDKLGCPIWIFPAGRWDIKGMLSSVPVDDVAMNLVYLLEKSRVEEEQQSEKLGNIVSKKTIIVDLEGIDYTVAMWKTAWKLVAKLTIVAGSHYPDCLNSVFVINAAPFIPTVFNTIKPLLNDAISKIIKIYSSDRSKWVPALLDEIDQSQLPKHWGGTMADPDGDPRCSSKVCVQFEFPKSIYMKNLHVNGRKKLKTAFVDVSDKTRLDMDVPIEGSKLRWMFYADGFDIDFKIHRQGVDGSFEVVNLHREPCYFLMAEGETTILKAGKYVVTFDNSYYKLKAKTISYSISVVPPRQK